MVNHQKIIEKPIINGVRLNLKSLQAISHDCRPEICKNQHTCCSRYVPHVTPEKMKTIVGCFPTVANYAGSIAEGDGFQNVFEDWEDGTFRIDANANEACIFTYKVGSGEMFCSLHTAALDLQLSPVAIKPSVCSLWPLILLDGVPPELSVDKNWKAFPCNRESDDPNHLDSGVVNTVASYFGESFLEKLLEYEGQD